MNHTPMAKVFLVAACFCTSQLFAQFSISGKIASANSEPVSYALIGVKNTQLSTVAGYDGNYSLKGLRAGTYIVTVKSLGFNERADTIAVYGDMEYNLVLTSSNKQLDEVVVNATRVDKGSGMAFSNIDSETLNKQNLGQDAPYMLAQLPGVVVNSDAGNAVGYTGLRIRGSDGTRINVTINGVPVNDAESQGSFFVDMPDLVSSTNNIQVQRGVGASSNGAGAFGASINFQTNQLNDKPYSKVISTAGSFNTFRNTLAAGTGLLNDKFTLDARASSIKSDGYIDRASSNLQSYYLAAGYYGKKSVLKFINFFGTEKTYQAWNYVSEENIKNGKRTYNEVGLYYDAQGNAKFYDNETDNYKQNNFQLHFIQQFNARLSLNITGHYTKGAGYYEQYKGMQSLANYNIPYPVLRLNDSTSLEVKQSDLIRRQWLDNDFAGGIFNLNYTASSKLSFVLGGGYNTYFGKHFGNVIWAQYMSTVPINHRYYMNTGNKNDGNIYLKTNIKANRKLNLFIDLQVRNIEYSFYGVNSVLVEQKQTQRYKFFNPKLGLSYDLNARVNLYASVAVAHKEPNRNDFIENKPSNRPKPEQLTDVEAGAKYTAKQFYASVNLYDMQYINQLVLNGQINDVGAYKRVNVAGSFRRGVELEANAGLNKFVALGGNLCLSENKIRKYVDYTDSFSVVGAYTQYRKEYTNTDILLSPNLVASAVLTLKPVKNLELSLINKNVGRQYLDNTSNKSRSINPYSLLDLRINYTIKTKLIPEISFMFGVYNLTNQLYETNGYTFSYYSDSSLNTYNYKAPAATTNVMGGFSLKF